MTMPWRCCLARQASKLYSMLQAAVDEPCTWSGMTCYTSEYTGAEVFSLWMYYTGLTGTLDTWSAIIPVHQYSLAAHT